MITTLDARQVWSCIREDNHDPVSMAAAHLLVIGEREALAWVLSEQRMAFPPSREEAIALRPDALLLLYTTRGCFHNPTRDRGRVIGEARVAGPVERLRQPVRFGGRDFTIGCALTLERIVALGEGVELAPLVPRLAAFPDPSSWSARMRRPLVPLDDRDLALIRSHLARIAPQDRHDAVASYLVAVRTR